MVSQSYHEGYVKSCQYSYTANLTGLQLETNNKASYIGKTRQFNVEYCQERIKKSKNKNNKTEKIRHPLNNGSPHVSESKTVLDSGFHVVYSG